MRKKLTEKKIRGLAATGKVFDILHEGTPAAGLRVSSLGAKIWYYLYRSPILRDEKGEPKQRRAYLGYHPSGRRPDLQPKGRILAALSLEEFERAYDVFRGELAKGIDPQTFGVTLPETACWIAAETIPDLVRPLYPEGFREGTFAALLVDYFRDYAAVNLKARSAASYKHAAKSFATVLGQRAPGEITSQDVRAILTTVEKRAPQMVREVKKVLSAIFEYGRSSDWHLAGNPAQGLRIMVKKGKRDRWLSDGELTTAFSAFEALSNRKAADVYRLILYSMCRPGEAAYVCAEDILVSNSERVWRIHGKNGKEFLVPLLGPIGEILNRRCLEVGGKGPLFWARNDRTYPQALLDANVKFRRLSGLQNIRPHDFRRTGRTHISALGVADSVAEALLNHVKDEIESTYNLYTYWRERKQALGLWHEKLTRLEREAQQRAA